MGKNNSISCSRKIYACKLKNSQ